MKIKTTLLFWTLILVACSSGISSPLASPNRITAETVSPQPDIDATLELLPNLQTNAPSGPKIIVTVGTPNIGQPPDGNFSNPGTTSEVCAFSWAQYRLEELTNVFDVAVKDLNPKTSGYASAFGEDCIYQDGRKFFGAIETDFYIDLPVTDLTDYETFGNWIAETMPVVFSMPPDMIKGPQKGFVEYKFSKTANDFLKVRVPIQGYNDSATGMTGETLFQFFYSK